MTAPAAIQADFVDLKFIKGRKVMQVILELPIEAGATFVATFGTPNPSTGTPVALARIQPAAKAEPERKQWDDLSLAQQAGILCSDPQFQTWFSVPTAEAAATKLRIRCNIASRSELDTNRDAARRFREINSGYRATLRGAA